MNMCHPSVPLKGSHIHPLRTTPSAAHRTSALLLFHAAFLRQNIQQECVWSYSKGFEDMATASSCCEGMADPLSPAGDNAKFPGSVFRRMKIEQYLPRSSHGSSSTTCKG